MGVLNEENTEDFKGKLLEERCSILKRVGIPEEVTTLEQLSDEASLAGTEARKDILRIEFISSLSLAPSSATDVSEKQDKSVLCWTEDGIMKIAGEGAVYANEDSSSLFAAYINVKEIHFGVVFNTSNVANMAGLFSGCSSLSNIDVSNWDTSNMTNMVGLFSGCSSLSNVDISNWDTSNVIDMSDLFSECSSLGNIDVL